VLHEHGLASALGWLGEQFEHKHDLQVDVQVGRIDPLPEELRIFLFQAARELLTNVVKHADTRRARVRGKREGGWIWIEVSDRGCGSSARSRRESGGELGFGLFSIRERSSYFGGQFELESESNRGTRARVRLPLRARAS
jgi:signal transduction histidine kinase